jgi:hypothetical protein
MHQVTGPKVTVAMRYGDSETAPWVSFCGTVDEIGADMTLFFNLSEEQANQAVGAIVAQAAGETRAVGLLADRLGATPLSAAQATPRATPAPQPRPVETAEAPALEGIHPLYAEIKRHSDITTLRRLWAENRAEFDANPDLMAALNAHVKAIESKAPAPV